MTLLAVTDTHALLWYATGRTRRLGKDARRIFARADDGQAAIFIPTLVLAEALDIHDRGLVTLEPDGETWVRNVLGCGSYFAADLTVPVVLRARSLRAIPARTDRLIAATALDRDLPLITRDPEIATAAGVDVVW